MTAYVVDASLYNALHGSAVSALVLHVRDL
jgi:hypothetical protein